MNKQKFIKIYKKIRLNLWDVVWVLCSKDTKILIKNDFDIESAVDAAVRKASQN